MPENKKTQLIHESLSILINTINIFSKYYDKQFFEFNSLFKLN